uniref:V-set and transmembrane domain containing 2 like n=1 Tax=Cyprinus carpio TaxID=7962 RepID=A0A8C1R591_CYPCA
MGSFGEMLWIIHSVGLYAQISANLAVDNHVSGNGRCEERKQSVLTFILNVCVQVVSQENTPKGATKISVVKVVGSNISHKLRLSSVRPSDEGTYECQVIDFSEGRAQRHRVQAYLQIQPDTEEEKNTSEQNTGPEDHQMSHHKREEQRMWQVAHQFHEEDLHQLQEGNKTRAGKKQQSESRDLKTE